MKALIYKDFYTLRGYLLKQGALMAVVYIGISVFMKSFTFFAAMFVMTLMMLLISSFNLDEVSRVNTYLLTMPVNKIDIVRGKYVLVMGWLSIGSIVCGLLCTLLDMISFRKGAIEIWSTNLLVMVVYLLAISFVLPIFLLLPAEKARIWMTLSMLVPFFFFMLIADFLPEGSDSTDLPWGIIAAGIAILLIVVITASYQVSKKLIQRKEF